jgi:hypothetical protein
MYVLSAAQALVATIINISQVVYGIPFKAWQIEKSIDPQK